MPYIVPGCPRIKLLSTSGVVATYNLPPPDRDKWTIEWVEKTVKTETMLDGSEQTRRLGWIPELKLSWEVYNDVMKQTPFTFGSASGDILDFPSLLAVLDNPYGSLVVSPNQTSGGFLIGKTTISAINTVGSQGLVTGLTITLRCGGTPIYGSYPSIYSSKILGAF